MEQEGFDAARWKAWQTRWFAEGLRTMEARLASEAETGQFCHGDTVTFADLSLMSCVNGVRAFKLDVAPMPIIDRIVLACDGLNAFANAHPLLQAGAPAH